MDERYWPFPVVKPEASWTEFDRELLDLMKVAYTEGYCPRLDAGESVVGLGSWPAGRSASLVLRGRRNGWEPFLGEADRPVRLGPSYGLPVGECACVCVRPPFRAAAHLALEWMRGRSLDSLLSDFVFIGGNPSGIVLKPSVVPAVQVAPDQDP